MHNDAVEALARSLHDALSTSDIALGVDITNIDNLYIVSLWDEAAQITRLIVCCAPEQWDAAHEIARHRAQQFSQQMSEEVGGQVDVLASIACTDGRREQL